MATMNVSLPDPMKDWVEAQAKTGRYLNASDYVRDIAATAAANDLAIATRDTSPFEAAALNVINPWST
jgi:antitoxin ParD1/3/4